MIATDGSVNKNGHKPAGVCSCHPQNIFAGSNVTFSKIVPTTLLCSPHLVSLLPLALSLTSVLPSSLKTVEQWPQFWYQTLVPHEDICFCPKPALKWFSLILLWRWFNLNQNREHPAWGTDVELLLNLHSYPNSVALTSGDFSVEICVCVICEGEI